MMTWSASCTKQTWITTWTSDIRTLEKQYPNQTVNNDEDDVIRVVVSYFTSNGWFYDLVSLVPFLEPFFSTGLGFLFLTVYDLQV